MAKVRPRRAGIIVPLGLTILLISLGADISPLSFPRLDYLGIPYPHILRYTYVFAPVAALILWIMFKRSMLLVAIVYLAVMTSVTSWANSQPIRIPITRWIDSYDLETWEKKLGYKVWEQGGSEGNALWVDRTSGRAEQVSEEVKRLGIGTP